MRVDCSPHSGQRRRQGLSGGMERGPREGRVQRPGGPSRLQGKLGGLPTGPHRLGTCPGPGISAGGSAGIGSGWCGRWGSSAGGCRRRPRHSAGSGGRNPGEAGGDRVAGRGQASSAPSASSPRALTPAFPGPAVSFLSSISWCDCDLSCNRFPSLRQGPYVQGPPGQAPPRPPQEPIPGSMATDHPLLISRTPCARVRSPCTPHR